MVKNLHKLLLSSMLVLFAGCGGDSSSTTNPSITLADTYTSWTVAKNNLVNDASKPIDEHMMKVLIEPNKQIGEDNTSKTVDFIYGKINGSDIGLGINQNYTAGAKMVVRVYDTSGDTLATSEEIIYLGNDNNIKFDDINF